MKTDAITYNPKTQGAWTFIIDSLIKDGYTDKSKSGIGTFTEFPIITVWIKDMKFQTSDY